MARQKSMAIAAEKEASFQRCLAYINSTSGVKVAEANFLKGEKALIVRTVGVDWLEPHIDGFAGDPKKMETREDLAGIVTPACREILKTKFYIRFMTDYNLTMLRLLGLRNVGEHGAESYPGKALIEGGQP